MKKIHINWETMTADQKNHLLKRSGLGDKGLTAIPWESLPRWQQEAIKAKAEKSGIVVFENEPKSEEQEIFETKCRIKADPDYIQKLTAAGR